MKLTASLCLASCLLAVSPVLTAEPAAKAVTIEPILTPLNAAIAKCEGLHQSSGKAKP